MEVGEKVAGALALTLQPTQLSIGMVSAILAWNMVIRNTGETHLVALRLWSDMIAAHGSVSEEEQLGGPASAHAQLVPIARIDPGQQAVLTGEWQLPLDEIIPIAQDDMLMMLPLGRVRIVGAGIAPRRHAFLVGMPPVPGGDRLRPVRLDLGPRTVSGLAAKLLA